MYWAGLALLAWIIFIHSSGIYLFLHGFLLNRLSLPDITPSNETLPATHKRAVVLIIDALRFDFVAPEDALPKAVSPHHHNVLNLPRELTERQPGQSFLFNSYADPPTTTLQRIKGITTGSLPTFVDMGSNFGGSAIDEDSMIKQLRLSGKKVAFMGDDTWMTAFSDELHPNMSFPYDSFNVEDLHTVDEGVISHMFPLLAADTASWDVLIGHFLGVDHVGHRLGPDHPTMRAKLTQMEDVITRVVDRMEDDTLLVLLGDHGMDRTGDHGGDGALETAAGLWFYSKTPLIHGTSSKSIFSTSSAVQLPDALIPKTFYPGSVSPHRTVQQIDLLPTLSLLLGLPIPFNNLGTVIPELFNTDSRLTDALALNARQIHTYLETYRASSAGAELDMAWDALEDAWGKADGGGAQLEAQYAYNRLALETCRALWAQFNLMLMLLGLALLAAGSISTWMVFARSRALAGAWEEWLGLLLARSLRGAAGGAVLGVAFFRTFGEEPFLQGVEALDYVLFAAPFMSAVVLSLSDGLWLPMPSASALWSTTPLLLHALSLASNSFTIWEERMTTYLLLSSVLPAHIRAGLTAPSPRLRLRILGFTALFAACARAAGALTVCREELGGACVATFFAGTEPPAWALVLAPVFAGALPMAVWWFLSTSKSDRGVAKLIVPYVLPAITMLATVFWELEYADSAALFGEEWSSVLKGARTAAAWLALVLVVAGLVLWWYAPLCLEIQVKTDGKAAQKRSQVVILGFGNAYGAPYALLFALAFSFTWLFTQLAGQAALIFAGVAVLAHLEAVDSMRDAAAINAAFGAAGGELESVLARAGHNVGTVSFAEAVPLALLGTQLFFATGHQAAIPSIQWKTAFVLTSGVVQPWSAGSVVVNAFGGLLLVGVAAPLLGLWNISPIAQTTANETSGASKKAALTKNDSASRVSLQTLRATLGLILYYSVVLLAALSFAGALRRHLMVWKVWAPRVGLAVASWGAVAFGGTLGWALGVTRVVGQNGVGRVLSVVGGGS